MTDQTRARLTPDELRELFLFEELDDDRLAWLAERGWVEEHPAGSTVLVEGEPADVFMVLLSGTITLVRKVGDDEVELARTDQVGAYSGATRSFVGNENHAANSSGPGYTASMRAITDIRVWAIHGDDFAEAIRTWFPMAVHLLEGVSLGMQTANQRVGERVRLQALGTITAGLMHELNNPAAAARRATEGLHERVAGMRHKLAMLAHGQIDKALLAVLVDVQEEAVRAAADAPDLSAVEESAREDEITDWLEDHGIAGAWDLAPIFVGGGAEPPFLDKVAGAAPAEGLESALRWIAYTIETELLLGEMAESVTRISTLIDRVRDYSRMDRVPYARLDVHEGLKSTMVMLASKLKDIEVVKDFDRTLPPVPVYGAEINQVWTNLIDNAIQAMDGHGTLTVRTQRDGDSRVLVSIGDTGPGIPPDIKDRIFQPFFTTKGVGQGTGLGLDISYRIVVGRHRGAIWVESEPGQTEFKVCLPLTEPPSEDVPAAPSDDDPPHQDPTSEGS